MSIKGNTSKLQALLEGVNNLPTGGYEQGVADGKQAAYDAFWDAYQERGKRTNYNYAYHGYGWTDTTYDPKYFPIKPRYCAAMYSNSGITDTKGPLDFSNTVGDGIASFAGCTALVTVRTLTVQSMHTYNGVFGSCRALRNITFEGEIGNDISFADCTKLSSASFYSVRDHLSDTSTEKTVTFSTTAVVAAGWDDTSMPDGLDQFGWNDFCAAKPNWTFKLV